MSTTTLATQRTRLQKNNRDVLRAIVVRQYAPSSSMGDDRNMWMIRIALCALLGFSIPHVRDSASNDSPVQHIQSPLQWIAFIGALIIGCYLGHHLVEKPGIALGKRLLGEHTKTNSLEATAPAP